MVRLVCKTHGVRLEVDEGGNRHVTLRMGEWVPGPCMLPLLPDPKPGKYGACEVISG
jgi:hypothetical protein